MPDSLHQKLIAEYPYKTELHAHTSPCSACSHIPPETMVELYRNIGCTTVTITNHLNPEKWTYSGDSECRKLAEVYLADYYAVVNAAKGSDLNVLLGVEIRFSENFNDYLVYGVSPDEIAHFISLIPYGIRNFYKEVKTDHNLILQAHPFRKNMELAPVDCIDGIEVMNLHPGHNSAVALAARYAAEHRMIISGGTDCHYTGHEGMCVIRTADRISDSYALADILKKREFLFDISGNLMIPNAY